MPTPNETAAQQVEQVAQALKLRIRGAGRTQREVEQELVMGKDYLRQLLSGNMDLKLKHLFAVLAVLGEGPTEFIASIFGLPAGMRPPGPVHPLFPESYALAVIPLLVRNLREKGILSEEESRALLTALMPVPQTG